MSLHLQMQKSSAASTSSSSSSSTSSENLKKSPSSVQNTSVFSIDNILNSQKVPKLELENDEDVSSSPSPTCSTTGYTLDSLQNLDRRSLNKKGLVK